MNDAFCFRPLWGIVNTHPKKNESAAQLPFSKESPATASCLFNMFVFPTQRKIYSECPAPAEVGGTRDGLPRYVESGSGVPFWIAVFNALSNVLDSWILFWIISDYIWLLCIQVLFWLQLVTIHTNVLSTVYCYVSVTIETLWICFRFTGCT